MKKMLAARPTMKINSQAVRLGIKTKTMNAARLKLIASKGNRLTRPSAKRFIPTPPPDRSTQPGNRNNGF